MVYSPNKYPTTNTSDPRVKYLKQSEVGTNTPSTNTPSGTVVECQTEDPKVPSSNTDQDKK